MQPSIAHASGHLDQHTTPPASFTTPSPCSLHLLGYHLFSVPLRVGGSVCLSTQQVNKLLQVAYNWTRLGIEPMTYHCTHHSIVLVVRSRSVVYFNNEF